MASPNTPNTAQGGSASLGLADEFHQVAGIGQVPRAHTGVFRGVAAEGEDTPDAQGDEFIHEVQQILSGIAYAGQVGQWAK